MTKIFPFLLSLKFNIDYFYFTGYILSVFHKTIPKLNKHKLKSIFILCFIFTHLIYVHTQLLNTTDFFCILLILFFVTISMIHQPSVLLC